MLGWAIGHIEKERKGGGGGGKPRIRLGKTGPRGRMYAPTKGTVAIAKSKFIKAGKGARAGIREHLRYIQERERGGVGDGCSLGRFLQDGIHGGRGFLRDVGVQRQGGHQAGQEKADESGGEFHGNRRSSLEKSAGASSRGLGRRKASSFANATEDKRAQTKDGRGCGSDLGRDGRVRARSHRNAAHQILARCSGLRHIGSPSLMPKAS